VKAQQRPSFSLHYDAATWSQGDVLRWLRELGVADVAAAVEAHGAVDGAVLMAADLAALQRFGVHKLGHRKLIVKAVEQLRAQRRNHPYVLPTP
jgi:hypothetical protein